MRFRHSRSPRACRQAHSCVPVLLAILALWTAFASPCPACRIIPPPYPWPPHPPHPIPPPHPVPASKPMTTKQHHADIHIAGRRAQVELEAVFHNPNAHRIEGTYLFPVPRTAVVSSFSMTVNGQRIEAELLPADEARKTYEDIVRKLKDPALLEYWGEGLLKARIFPIEPNSDVRVQLAYDDTVEQDGISNVFRFTYPLLSADPGNGGHIDDLRITVRITDNGDIKTIVAPGFDTEVERQGNREARLVLTRTDYTPERDFPLVFSSSESDVGVSMLTYRDPRSQQGYFALVATPNTQDVDAPVLPKNMTFVVDSSGSMAGPKIRQVQDALRYCLRRLRPVDRFSLMNFATDVIPYSKEPVQATPDAVEQAARDFVDQLKARGGTALDSALAATLEISADPERVGILVLLTDGLPTVGRTDVDGILRRLDKQTAPGRIFTFGVGYDVNTRLLDGIAGRTGGYPTYVVPGENLELSLTAFFERMASPVMTTVRLDSGNVRLTKTAPVQLPDLFRGTQVIFCGQHDGHGKTTFQLTGTVGGRTVSQPVPADLDGDPANAFVARLWAQRRVAFLQQHIRQNGEKKELVDEITALGKEFGIVTPYTSFLVVDPKAVPPPPRPTAGGTRPPRPEPYLRGHAGTWGGANDAAAPAAESGRRAVDESRLSAKMLDAGQALSEAAADSAATYTTQLVREAGYAALPKQEAVRNAGARTFRKAAADFWYESTLELPNNGSVPQDATRVEAWSDEFFTLLKQHPDLRRYTRAGLPLLLRLDGALYYITAPRT